MRRKKIHEVKKACLKVVRNAQPNEIRYGEKEGKAQ